MLGNQAAAIGLAIVGVYVLLAVTADWLPIKSPVQIVGANRMAGPSWSMPLGADTFGRDLLSRIVFGARLSLQVSAISVAIALVSRLVAGARGRLRGRLDRPAHHAHHGRAVCVSGGAAGAGRGGCPRAQPEAT